MRRTTVESCRREVSERDQSTRLDLGKDRAVSIPLLLMGVRADLLVYDRNVAGRNEQTLSTVQPNYGRWVGLDIAATVGTLVDCIGAIVLIHRSTLYASDRELFRAPYRMLHHVPERSLQDGERPECEH